MTDGAARYRLVAPVYDMLSGERLVYRQGRAALVELLDLRLGQRVLLVGCGTGLDFPFLAPAVGAQGSVVGVDRCRAMMRRAEAKIRRAAWSQVQLIVDDAESLTRVDGTFDAVLFTYSLSVIDDWHSAWAAAVSRLRPGGKVGVLDTALPTGNGWPLRPLAKLAMWAGGVDGTRRVWELVGQEAEHVSNRQLAHGHLRLAVGTIGQPKS